MAQSLFLFLFRGGSLCSFFSREMAQHSQYSSTDLLLAAMIWGSNLLSGAPLQGMENLYGLHLSHHEDITHFWNFAKCYKSSKIVFSEGGGNIVDIVRYV